MLVASCLFKEDGTLLESQIPNIVVGDKESVKLEVSFYEDYDNLKLLDLSNYVVEAVFERPDGKVSPALLLGIDVESNNKKYLIFGGWITEVAGISKITIRLKKDGTVKATGFLTFTIQDGNVPADVVITEPQFEALEEAINEEEQARIADFQQAQADREAGDQQLDAQIKEVDERLQGNIDYETSEREKNDAELQRQINEQATNLQQLDQSASNNFTILDGLLKLKLNKVFNDIALASNLGENDYFVINSGNIAYRISFANLKELLGSTGSGEIVADHYKGDYLTLQSLKETYPTAEAGDYAFVNTSSAYEEPDVLIMYIWDSDAQDWKETKSGQYVLTTTFAEFQEMLLQGTFVVKTANAARKYINNENEELNIDESVNYTSNTPSTVAVGGIAKGTSFVSTPVVEIIDQLLHPYVAFSASISTSPVNGGVYEVGTTQSITSATVNITLGSASITSITLYNGSTVLGTKTSGIGTSNIFTGLSVAITSSSTNKNLKATIVDSTGQSKTVASSTLTFVNPYYYGVINSGDELTETLIKGLTKSVTAKGTKAFTYTMNQQKAVIAYPSSYGNIAKILDENSFNVTETFTKNTLTVGGVSYNVYVLNDVNTTTMKYTFSY